MNRIIDEDIDRILAAPLPWDKLKGTMVLVTGASGMIGGYCAKVAERVAEMVITLDRHELYAPFRFSGADFIIHAASPASPRAYCADPIGTIRANTVATQRLLELARDSEGMLFLSSGEVYGENAPAPCPETYHGPLDHLCPRNVYAQAKRMGESLCATANHRDMVPAKIARISHTYGPGMDLDNDGRVFADFVGDIVNKRDIVMKSDGLAKRPFAYLADTVLGLFTILLKGAPGPYNVGAEVETRIGYLAGMLAGMYPPTKVIRERRAETDLYIQSPVHCGHLDISKIRALGWQPTIGIEEGFRRTVASYE